jgi:hypothetical protein
LPAITSPAGCAAQAGEQAHCGNCRGKFSDLLLRMECERTPAPTCSSWACRAGPSGLSQHPLVPVGRDRAPCPQRHRIPRDMQAATHRQGLASAGPQWGTTLRTQHKGLGLTSQPARQVKPAAGRPPQFRCGRPLGCVGRGAGLGWRERNPTSALCRLVFERNMRQAVARMTALILRCQAGPALLVPLPLPRRPRSYHALPTVAHPVPVVAGPCARTWTSRG